MHQITLSLQKYKKIYMKSLNSLYGQRVSEMVDHGYSSLSVDHERVHELKDGVHSLWTCGSYALKKKSKGRKRSK